MGRIPAFLLTGLLFAAVACSEPPSADAAPTAFLDQEPGARQPGRTLAERQENVDASRRTAIVEAAERVAPAVVSVNVIRRERVQPRSWYDQLFLPPGAERRVQGLGSGFIIHPDGLVLTNDHVVHGASQIVVTLADGTDYGAELVGTDEVNDLALLRLKTDGKALPVAPLGRSDDLLIGEWVVAIGNPFGYLLSNTEPTVTAGVVSGVRRNIIPTQEDENQGYYLGMIQTDASINPGNSGGPLVNAKGEVIGVNSSIFSRSGGSEGLGFAIPIDRARRVVLELVDHGEIQRPWTGLELEPANPNQFGRSREVKVARVAPGSPAQKAALRAGEVVRSVNGRTLRTPLDWEAAMLEVGVGDTLRVGVGDSGERTVQLVSADLPSISAERVNALQEFELVTLTPAIQSERGLSNDHGALIVNVSDNVRRTLGLRPGDLIVAINRYAVRSAEEAADLLRQIQDTPGRVPVRMLVERSGREFYTGFLL